ncbi:MAG: hypothetical protein JWR80_8922 [Bradyrhizobium sp.]|nr:hypothetical protein [Bradyrhizobium sp.]
MTDHHEIDRSTFRRGVTQGVAELHITGGIRAVEQPGRLWSWYPVIAGGATQQLAPLSIGKIADLAGKIGLDLFGGDQQSGLETPLISRIWTPLQYPHDGGPQPADTWRGIAKNADKAGDAAYALLARHLAFSLVAAGIRLRDASDGYQVQLDHAVHSGRKAGSRFSNIPMYDLHLAFHSVLSELASARDYLAASLASKLGAPANIDAMNKFARWIGAASRADLRDGVVVRQFLDAYDQGSADPWLFQLTEYRNQFLHRQPMGSTTSPQRLRYDIVEHGGILYPRITMPLDAADPSAPGQDALTRFIQLYRAMTRLMTLAADHAPYSPAVEAFVVS